MDKKKNINQKFWGKGPSAFCRRASIMKANYPKLYKRFSTNWSDALGWECYLPVTAKLTLTPATTGKTFTQQRDSGDNATLFRLMKTLTFPLLGHCCIACGRSPNQSVGTQYLFMPTGCFDHGRGQRRSLAPTILKPSFPPALKITFYKIPGKHTQNSGD